jgi:hypothetical protein
MALPTRLDAELRLYVASSRPRPAPAPVRPIGVVRPVFLINRRHHRDHRYHRLGSLAARQTSQCALRFPVFKRAGEARPRRAPTRALRAE